MSASFKIVVPTDFSKGSEEALDWVKRLSVGGPTEIHCINVVPEPMMYMPVAAGAAFPAIPSVNELERISGESLQETMFFHVDSGKLASVLQHLKDGRTVDGKELSKAVEFVMGSGVESPWGKNVPKQGMQELETMREMGTGYFLTTPIFDLDQFERFLRQIKTFDVPVIACKKIS